MEIVSAPPEVRVTDPCALRKPLATASMLYVPAGAVRLKVPSGFAATDATTELFTSNRLTVTGLLASTCPVNEPTGKGVGDASGVNVNVGVGETSGVKVKVGVGDSAGVDVKVAVAEPSGVEVAVADPSGVEVAVAEPSGVEVAVAEPSGVEVAVAEPSGVEVAVAEPSGVEVNVGEGDVSGVGVNVGVEEEPVTVTLVPVDEMVIRTLSPLETRAVHSTAD